MLFGILALVFSIVSTEHLVLLARTSFTGTAMMAPMILLGILSKTRPSSLLPLITLVVLIIFIVTKLGYLPAQLFDLQLELILFSILIVAVLAEVLG